MKKSYFLLYIQKQKLYDASITVYFYLHSHLNLYSKMFAFLHWREKKSVSSALFSILHIHEYKDL